MAEITKRKYQWPKNSWTILDKIVRAWYTAEHGASEVTQKKIAEIAGVQQSQVSSNKPFLQSIGIVEAEGLSLTDAGKRLGLGLSNANIGMVQQGFQQVIKEDPVLRDLVDIIRGRGSLKLKDFSDEICLRTNGKNEAGFATGTSIFTAILTNSGLVELTGDTLRPLKQRIEEEAQRREPEPSRKSKLEEPTAIGLKRIPIAVSTSSVWWIEVAETP